jgi:hypothetical protein
MKISPAVLGICLSFSFPVCIAVAWFIGRASFGEFLLSSQLSLISLAVQKNAWSERDYYEVRNFLFREKM